MAEEANDSPISGHGYAKDFTDDLLQIETEGGVVGWGEGTLEGHTEAVQGSLRDIERR